MGMSCDNCVISGVWSGRFYHDRYDPDGERFSAWLKRDKDRIAGTVLEPNKFADLQQDELDADIRGHIHDTEIELLKTYRSVDQEPVYCEGEISEDGQRITGKWYLGWPDEKSGSFEMTRSSAPVKAAQARPEKANL